MNIDLTSLGLSPERITELVVEEITSTLLARDLSDSVRHEVNKNIEKKVVETVALIANEQITPNVESLIRGATFKVHNKWGEPKSEPLTFLEFLEHRTTKYLQEDVDNNGKAQGEPDTYNWRSSGQTRITYLINRFLAEKINTQIKTAMDQFNSTIAEGIAKTVENKVKEALNALKVNTTIK